MDLKQEVRSTLQRIHDNPAITGVIVVDPEGEIKQSTLDNNSESTRYAESVRVLATKSKSTVKDLDPSNELTILRVLSKRRELILAPRKDFTMIVVQKPKLGKGKPTRPLNSYD